MTALARRHAAPAAHEDIALAIPRGFRLASGEALPDTQISLRRFGAPDGPQVIALGGISAGRDVCGEAGWWRETFVDHGGVDLARFGVIGVDFAPSDDVRLRLSPGDQARLLLHVLDTLQIEQLHGFIGASYGGLVGLALASLAPWRLQQLCVISAAHRQAAQSLAWRGVQRRIVEFGLAHGDADAGLSLARQLAMITYRTPEEFEERFSAGIDADGRGAVDRYLESRGDAYTGVARSQRWLTLSEAIDRAAVDPALVRARTTLIASADDQLVPLPIMRELGERLPNLAALHVLPSFYGHDAFLKEPARLAPLLFQFLNDGGHA
jgi:homoserine O-acetyltransferase